MIIVYCSSVAGYVADCSGPAKLFDLGDIDSQKWLLHSRHRSLPLAAGYWLEGIKLERAEKLLARKFDLCTCTTQAELTTFERFETGVPSDWFPNGVDNDYFSPVSAEYDPDLVCFVGRVDYYPNQEAMLTFCGNVWPLIRKVRPQTQLKIVGASPSKGIIGLGKIRGIMVTGSVADVRPHVQRAALTVAPRSIARGAQNKIFESIAMGVPVVVSVNAATGVDAVPGEYLLAAETARDYRDAILSVLRDQETNAFCQGRASKSVAAA